MFTGIIECTGKLLKLSGSGSNTSFEIQAPISHELKVDQSVSHNGVCLTVETTDKDKYTVTAIAETLKKSNLGSLKTNSIINLERSLTLNKLIDGHLVQGHVDSVAVCKSIIDENGSYVFTFTYDEAFYDLLIEKGSVALNGVSLTAFNCIENEFSVAIIPYTYKHTNFHTLSVGEKVNIEFDIIGKYLKRMKR